MNNNPSTIWDYPVTDTELDSHYGREVTQSELSEVIGRHAAAFDADDLAELAHENSFLILGYIAENEPESAGVLLQEERLKIIARRASMEIYGKPGLINPNDVNS